jgi:hypothetical protein
MPLETWQIIGALVMIAITFVIAYYFEKRRPFEKKRIESGQG